MMLNSSRFFWKHAQIRDGFVVFLSHRLKILVELRTHHARTVKRISFEYRNIWVSNKFFKKWLLCWLFCLCSFITYSSSKNGRKTTASKLLTHRFSAGRVGEFFQFWLLARLPRTNFDTKIVNFVLKLVLPCDTLRKYSQFFSFLLYVYCKNCFLVFFS